MEFIKKYKSGSITKVVIQRGKVNALNDQVVDELYKVLVELEKDNETNAVILTGYGKFFSFGFDIPQFLSYSREKFTDYLTKFTNLYTYMFMYSKPIIAALNGHTIAGGCMLALACDYRIMISENSKISLNEISFGSTVFAGSTEMLRFRVGNKNSTEILYSGSMYCAEEAKQLGLIDYIARGKELMRFSMDLANKMGEKSNPAFTSIKHLLRESIYREMKLEEKKSIEKFVEIWYSENTWKNLKNIKIY